LNPLSVDEWDGIVIEYHELVGPDCVKDGEDLRNKFKGLKNCKKPSGDPSCPEIVKRC
jgi:hypothetical protein